MFSKRCAPASFMQALALYLEKPLRLLILPPDNFPKGGSMVE